MITNSARVTYAQTVESVKYNTSPKSHKDSVDYERGERLLAMEGDNIKIGIGMSTDDSSNFVAEQLEMWNDKYREGKAAVKWPVIKGIVSFSESDTAKFTRTLPDGQTYLDTQAVINVVRQSVKMTMPGDRASAYYLHGDSRVLHVHFDVATVNSESKIYNKSFESKLWQDANRKLEIEHGLERVMSSDEVRYKAPSNAEKHLEMNSQESPQRNLQKDLIVCLETAEGDFNEFLENCELMNIRVKPNLSKTGKMNGFAFGVAEDTSFYKLNSDVETQCTNTYMKASHFGNAFKWSNLEKELHYDNTKHSNRLVELKERAIASEEEFIVRTSLGSDYSTTNNDEQSIELNKDRNSGGQFSASRNSPGELERDMPYRQPDVKSDAGTVRRDNDLSKRVGDSIPRPTISRVSTTDDYVKRISPIVPNIIERKPANIEPNPANGIRRQRDTKEISSRATEVNAGNESSRWDSNTKIDMENKVKIQPIPVFNNNFSYWNDVFDIPSTHDNMGDSSNNNHGNTNGASTEKTTSSATTNPITTTASTAAQEWDEWKDSMIYAASLNKKHYLLTNRNFRAGLSEKDKIGLNSLCEHEYKKTPEQRLSDIDKRVDFYISKIPNATVDDRKKSYELHYLESYKRVLLEEENIEYRKKAQQPLKPAMTPAPTQEDEEANAASKALNAIVVKDEQDAANKAAGKDKCRPGTDTSIGNC